MDFQDLMTFMNHAQDDARVTPLHISLYLVLFREALVKNANTVSFSRPAIMQAAKISSNATYHKCIRELHDFGYLQYIPSHHPVLGSLVFLKDFDNKERGNPKRT